MSSTAIDRISIDDFDEEKIDAIFADLDQCHGPGAAVGIAIGGKPVYRKGFGLASMELPVVLSTSTRMRIHSTTKHFTCLVLMLLCEEGKADINDQLINHLPDMNPVTRDVTLRQLMGNTSGLRDAHDISYQFSGIGRRVSGAQLLDFYRDLDDVNFVAGTDWCYNNGGFLLLTAIIERITGQPLEEVLRNRIFTPVGMNDTLLRRFDTDFVPNSATMHTKAPGTFEKSYLGLEIAGEGGIASTVDDMLLWLAHMNAPKVGTTATWALIKQPQVLANGTSTGYGLGLMSDCYRGVDILHHAGGGLGGNSQMLKVPALGLDIVCLLNRDDLSATLLTNQVLDACLPSLNSAPPTRPARLSIGTYCSPTSGRVIQLVVRERKQIVSIDGFDYPFEAGEDGLLRPSGLWAFLKQTITLAGDLKVPTAVQFDDFGNVDNLFSVRLVNKSQTPSIAGRYCSEATRTEVIIADRPGPARMRANGRFGCVDFDMECLADGIWRVTSACASFIRGVVSFEDNGALFRFSNYRTRSLVFRRHA